MIKYYPSVSCAASTCSSLITPANGQITFYYDASPPHDHLTVAVFVCNNGFELQGGDRMRTCFSNVSSLNGQWSGEQPTCARNSMTIIMHV